MISTTDSATLFAGNNSAATPYPVIWPSLDPLHVVVQKIAPGSGTVTVAAGVATFSASQTLEIGGRVRIASTIYYIATRVSATVYTFTIRPTISASAFWLPDVFTELSPSDFTYTVDGDGVLDSITTAVAVATTWLVLIFRRTPLLQDTALPVAGALPAATLERMADRDMLIEQETRSLMTGIVPSTVTVIPSPTLTQNSFPARTASGSGAADTAISVGSDFSLSGNTLALSGTYGDMFGPAVAPNLAIPFFDGTTGKHLRAGAGTNPAATPALDLGDITNTTPRPLLISQEWNNAGLTGTVLIVNADDGASDAGSYLQRWTATGANRGGLKKSGEFLLLNGNAAAPTHSFAASTGSGMYYDTGLWFSVGGVAELLIDNDGVHAVNAIIAPISSTPNFALTIASAATIAPTKEITFISGTAAIVTITPPLPISAGGGRITLIPLAAFTWTTAGNIAKAGTAVAFKALDLTFDSGTGLWYPSYV